jgi:hypothetical protein
MAEALIHTFMAEALIHTYMAEALIHTYMAEALIHTYMAEAEALIHTYFMVHGGGPYLALIPYCPYIHYPHATCHIMWDEGCGRDVGHMHIIHHGEDPKPHQKTEDQKPQVQRPATSRSDFRFLNAPHINNRPLKTSLSYAK